MISSKTDPLIINLHSVITTTISFYANYSITDHLCHYPLLTTYFYLCFFYYPIFKVFNVMIFHATAYSLL